MLVQTVWRRTGMLVADRDLARQDLPVQVSLLGWEKEVVLAVLMDWASETREEC